MANAAHHSRNNPERCTGKVLKKIAKDDLKEAFNFNSEKPVYNLSEVKSSDLLKTLKIGDQAAESVETFLSGKCQSRFNLNSQQQASQSQERKKYKIHPETIWIPAAHPQNNGSTPIYWDVL